MEDLLNKTVSASNRVSVLVGFVADNPPNRKDLIAEAFRVTEHSLLVLSQRGQGDEVARYLEKSKPFVPPASWADFVATQVSELQRVAMLQKLIEQLGDDLSSWQPKQVSPDTYVAALRGLEYLVMFDPQNQIQSWCEASIEECCDRLRALSRVLTGFTLIGLNNNVNVTDDIQAFTAISFAAQRLIDGGRDVTAA